MPRFSRPSRQKRTFSEPKTQLAIELLAQRPEPSAILVTDEALTLPENRAVWKTVLEYVRRGGTAVIMGHFPSFDRTT